MAYPNIYSLSSVAMRESATLFMTVKACVLSNYTGRGVLWIGREATLQVSAVLEITLFLSSWKSFKVNAAVRDTPTGIPQSHFNGFKSDSFDSWCLLMPSPGLIMWQSYKNAPKRLL